MKLIAGSGVSATRASGVDAARMMALVVGSSLACALVFIWEPPTQLLVLLFFSPALEETVFRAGLQECLIRHWWTNSLGWTNLATATAFSLSHVLVHGDLSAVVVALPALLIGRIYQQRRRLHECVALHATMNAVWLAWNTAGPALLGSH